MVDPERKITVLIVEDHPIYQDALRGHIEIRNSDFSLVGCTDMPDEAINIVEEHVPDVVLLDLELKHQVDAGERLITQIRNISPETRIVVLTAHREDELVFAAIQAGAVAYLLKDNVKSNEIANHIVEVHNGNPPFDHDIAKKLWAYFQGRLSTDVSSISESTKLTAREQEVLDLIVNKRSNLEIASELTISLSTVKTHVRNMLQKLHLSNRTELRMIAMARRFERRQ